MLKRTSYLNGAYLLELKSVTCNQNFSAKLRKEEEESQLEEGLNGDSFDSWRLNFRAFDGWRLSRGNFFHELKLILSFVFFNINNCVLEVVCGQSDVINVVNH